VVVADQEVMQAVLGVTSAERRLRIVDYDARASW
jgi:hypothetical protein